MLPLSPFQKTGDMSIDKNSVTVKKQTNKNLPLLTNSLKFVNIEAVEVWPIQYQMLKKAYSGEKVRDTFF